MPQLDIASFANQIIWLTIIFISLITIFRTSISTTYNKLAHYKKHLKRSFNMVKWNETTTIYLKNTWKKKLSKIINNFQVAKKILFPAKSYASPEKVATENSYTKWIVGGGNQKVASLSLSKRWVDLQVFCSWFTNALKK